ncbi:MAG: tetratricopeptide repeat protein [Pirellula sp.]|jgi:tetratricopeptide (TPR) repeat protein
MPTDKMLRTVVHLLGVMLSTFPSFAFSQSATSNSHLASLYQSATSLFAAQEYSASSRDFKAAAALCPNSELALQCEYFAAISDWNRTPNAEHAEAIEKWLEQAKRFEAQLESKGTRIASKGWNQWIEAAHLIQAKWEIQTNKLDTARRRLEILVGIEDPSKNESTPNGSDSLQKLAWPRDCACSANAWIELGYLALKLPDQEKLAHNCFDNAVQQCHASNESLLQKALWGNAQSCVRLEEWEQALAHLTQLQSTSLDDDLKIQAKLLESRIKLQLKMSIDVARAIEPLVALATTGNVGPQTTYDLALALLEFGLADKSDELFLNLSSRPASTPFVLEARIRVARNAALKSDWNQVKSFTQEMSQSDTPSPWTAFAQYFYGKALMKTDEMEKGLGIMSLALRAPDLSVDLETSIRLDISEALYQSEKWELAAAHLLWLANSASQSKSKPDWLPRVLLRQAEMLANKNSWKESENIVSVIRNDFPTWSAAPEVDYLLARCQIAKADFDAARKLLTRVLDSANSNPAIAARAGWMMGETYMMQRRYGDAINTYQQVLAIPNQSYWHAACAVQLGLCAELSQDTSTATEWYQKVTSSFTETPFAVTAQQRLVRIASETQQSQRIGSGTKR